MITQLDRTAFKRKMWHRAQSRNLKKYNDLLEGNNSEEIAMEGSRKHIFYTIKRYGTWQEKTKSGREQVDFETMSMTLDFLTLFTPRQFMEIFPVRKDFRGHKWEMKDYFYTMKHIKEIGMDNLIENPFEFLWEYQNDDTDAFMFTLIGVMGDVRREETGLGIIEEFFQNEGFDFFTN